MSIPPPDLRRLLGVAERAARAGGTAILGKLGTPGGQVEEKGAGDYVTEIDKASERLISMRLRGETPDIPIMAEEEGGETGERYWVVDPLDGTTNFVHGFPVVGVSVALVENGRPVVGCVHAPFAEETYTAVVGGGAHISLRRERATRIGVSERPTEKAIIATGFPFRNKSLIPRHLMALRKCLERFEDLRRPGAASLDLAWVASGVFEGYFELGLSSWDVAAGALLVEEAGGVVSDWDGGDDYLTGNILAGSPQVHEELLTIVQPPASAAPDPAPTPSPARPEPSVIENQRQGMQPGHDGVKGVPRPAEPLTPPLGGVAFPPGSTRPTTN